MSTRSHVDFLDKQRLKLETAARGILITPDWKQREAHLEEVSPSFGMLMWANSGKKQQHFSRKILADKQDLIREIPKLQEKGEIVLSEDITVVAEGCDDGTFISLLLAALTHDGKPRMIRSFLTNGSIEMVNKTCKLTYGLSEEKNRDMVYGGICDAYSCLPSEL